VTTTLGPDPGGADDPAAPAPTHSCVRCGAAVQLTDAPCAACNPAGLEQCVAGLGVAERTLSVDCAP
jgi:hypothetical protein